MSRKGKMPIALPKGVEVNVNNGLITVKGPKGTLTSQLHPSLLLKFEGELLHVEPNVEVTAEVRRIHGLARALIQNMITGISEGFKIQLELVGVGYRAHLKGEKIDLQLGFSHPTEMMIPEGVKVEIEKNTQVTISGIDKRLVGQFAASVRALKKPEPYQGKGIRYSKEVVRRKAGKAGKK
jgi:large subunit ribosomal protein L6